MKIFKQSEQISLVDLQIMADKMFGNLIKVVVDVDTGIVVLDMEMHVDGEQELLKNGSRQTNLWGINLYPALSGDDFVEFDSMINLRPSQGNRSRGVENKEIEVKIMAIINKLIIR